MTDWWKNTKKCKKLCNDVNMPGNNSVRIVDATNKSDTNQCQYWKCTWTKTHMVGNRITKTEIMVYVKLIQVNVNPPIK